jgi:hypothetical protein
MDIIQDVKSLSGVLGNGLLMTLLGAVILTSIVWHRTRSNHQIMVRIWTLFSDRKECEDPEIDRFLKERSALMQLRFTTGLKISTSDQAYKLIHYSKHNKIDFDDIRACGKHFDLSQPGLKEEKYLPKRWQLFLIFLLSLVFGISSLASFANIADNRMLIQLKGSSTWLELAEDRAKPLFSSNTLYFNQCKEDHLKLASTTRLSSGDIDILCQANKDEIKTYIKSNLPGQRLAFGLLATFLLYVTFVFFFPVQRGLAALKLHDVLRKINDEQSSLQMRDEPVEFPA